MAKKLDKVARLRLTFLTESDAMAFCSALSRFVNVRNSPSALATHADAIENRLKTMLFAASAGIPPASWGETEWPTESLEGLIRLCLKDPNFPGFVRKVHSLIKALTTTDLPVNEA